jgi:UDP-N-acetylmuramyl pentapeptide phosphotransferase/UDP-N-acetylglucosamine-1-phosphate transferase
VLGPFGFFLTLFAVWAAINAFNMVDGIDGLLGGCPPSLSPQSASFCGLMVSTAWRCGVLP